MKKILGLDLGTNSIGWSLIETDFGKKKGKIIGIGSRIIPMSQDILSEFGKGNTVSQTAVRTEYRGKRRLIQRTLLRRERLHRVLNIIGFLPEHYSEAIDFENRLGQFKDSSETKIVYKKSQDGSFQFLFTDAYNEMVEDFRQTQPHLFKNKGKDGNGEARRIPYDWTLYYLRKKALTQAINKEELAWILLNFNQKRGYYQLRGDEIEKEKDDSKKVEFVEILVNDVINTGEKQGKDQTKYKIMLENGMSFVKPSNKPVEWKGKLREFIITTELDEDGNAKLNSYNEVKRSFKSVDSEKDWIAIKTKAEKTINDSKKSVGCYIYDTLLQKPNQKIRGKLVRTIERKFYKNELEAILKTQARFHTELRSPVLLAQCADHLYANNYAHKNDLKKKDFLHLFLKDIIFYQRPLKSKKSLIAECKYEHRFYLDKETNEKKKQYVKCIAKSHPLFQEFRLWEFVQNLKIYQRENRVEGRLKTDVNVTEDFLGGESEIVKLFEFLNDRKSIKQSMFLKHFKLNDKTHRWNYVEENEYPCNETRASFIALLKKNKSFDWQSLLTNENVEKLWHTLYSVSEKEELKSALKKLAKRLNVAESILDPFNSLPPFKKDYGSFSAKALKKLVPLMRRGEYWLEENINRNTVDRIDKILTGEFDEEIQNRVRELIDKRNQDFQSISDFNGLPLWLASYIVYDRHAESDDLQKWKQPENIELLKQHSLRNPIVEQVINETLQVVKDIWKEYGGGEENFFDEIHVELGREMKNPKKDRERMTKQISNSKNTNERVRAILKELMTDKSIEGNVRDYSPSHQEIFKIYEEGVLIQYSEAELKKEKLGDISATAYDVSRKPDPTQREIQKYKLWLEQNYRSPYTGMGIPLSKLFTPDFEIEHVIPQSRYFDDSLNNKVICEAEVNKLKGNKTGYEFIEKHGGEKVTLAGGAEVEVSKIEAYEQFVQRNFRGRKKEIMLMPDIPESFTNRQMNDTRYISKVVLNLMSKIVREEGEQEPTSKNVIPVTGKITSRLKRDWGFNDVWNELLVPRFMRMNELTGTTDFGYEDEQVINGKPSGNKFFRTQVPDELKRYFEKKRIDHRHHALDALTIALASRSHVNYLNNQNAAEAKVNERIDLRNKLRRIEEKQIIDNKTHLPKKIQVAKEFLKPWQDITQEVSDALAKTVVSFKQNKRILTKTNNYYESYKDEDGQLRLDKAGIPQKGLVKQKGNNRSVRKPLHQETVHGKISLRDTKSVTFANGLKDWKNLVDKDLKTIIKRLYREGHDEKTTVKYFKKNPYCINNEEVRKVEVYYYKEELSATRKALDISFNTKTIESVTDTGIKQILLNHIEQNIYQNQLDDTGKQLAPETLAFSPEGIEEMNKNIKNLNKGKEHQPIYKVRKYEALGKKFPVGENGNRKEKYVVAASGTNLFFVIKEHRDTKKREFETVPLRDVIDAMKAGVPFVEEEVGYSWFTLSPNDLVYVPTDEEMENPSSVDFNNLSKEQVDRICRMEKASGIECYFIYNNVASLIKQYDSKSKIGEFGSQNKFEKTNDDIRIKERCWKLKVDRLGNVKKQQ